MRLEDIGFYTLSDGRAENASSGSGLSRCELILSSECNFNCPYCRGVRSDYDSTLSFDEAVGVVDLWADEGLKNIRFSGGEPTLWPNLEHLVEHSKDRGIGRVAISTNGSADTSKYVDLLTAGVDDFSISLDACCVQYGDRMTGTKGMFDKVCENIRALSKESYVTVGVVVTEDTVDTVRDVVEYASSLGAADVRIIPSAQYNRILTAAEGIGEGVLEKHPILKYRVDNIRRGIPVRGLTDVDPRRCFLMLDDMAVAGGFHFPCIIYMREGGDPAGRVGPDMRRERLGWVRSHDCFSDPICRDNCLDVCVDYNRKFQGFRIEKARLPRIASHLFSHQRWMAGSVHSLGVDHFRFTSLSEHQDKVKDRAVGWCPSENVQFRSKASHVCLMVETDDHDDFWFHIRNNEFMEMFCSYD